MSKFKISFSTVLMLIVMSLYSVVAFAAAPAAPTGLKAKIDANNQLTVQWTGDAAATGYKIFTTTKKADGTLNTAVEKATPTGTTATFSVADELKTIPSVSESFLVEVLATNIDGDSAKTKLWVQGANKDLIGTWQMDDAGKDNGINNANQSGMGVGGQNVNTGVLKSNEMVDNHGDKGAQRTHGEYQNNTNSCASCHQTHTAASKSLLFKDGVYSTCTACHDGTLGFYNVFGNGEDASSAGTFGGTHDGNMSAHMADGAVKIKAAPGGNPNGTGTWDKEFNCASCHSPHGSYSDRLLHYNPNNMAASTPTEGGIKAGGYTEATKVAVLPFASKETGTTRYIGVLGTKAEHGLTATKYDFIPATDIIVMIYEKAPGKTSYAKTDTPWMYGYPTRGSGTNSHYYYSRFFTKDPTTAGFLNANGTYPTANKADVVDHYDYLDDSAHIKYAYGLVYGDATSVVPNIKFAEVSRAYVVKLDLMPILDLAKDAAGDNDGKLDPGEEQTFGGVKITTVNQRALYAGETNPLSVNIKDRWGIATPGTDKVSGWGIAMSGYCSSCHTDYLASTSNQTAGTEGEGTWDKAFRHTTTSDSYTCVRCHFAHGTDVEVMTDAHLRDKAEVATDLKGYNPALTDAQAATLANDYLLDKGASSALKRFTNMSVCWSCHTSSKAEQLKNTDSYKYNDGDAMYDPRGIPTTEGKANWPAN